MCATSQEWENGALSTVDLGLFGLSLLMSRATDTHLDLVRPRDLTGQG